MKGINYRGGIVKLSIPEDWKEEYEPSGGATFYEDREDSGTLRLNVLTFEKNEGKEPFTDGKFEPFRDDLYLKSEFKRFEEDGTNCILLNWQVGYETEGNEYRIASFCHTVLEDQFRAESTKEEIKIIKWILQNAEFGKSKASIGDYEHERQNKTEEVTPLRALSHD
ncbi:hypothetical protein JIN85_20775 [Luteolibacter pohnpeiensis]|uniref:Uncharacterized protein n=2 Tax=Luteolibacter pohnpeiensis TaxID=454153 RepID=A0A934VWQ5_9BACT|nr:hypothetical protein [Luteolibacter pohnpeiensis]